ncbi:MAG: beta-lactamase family protein [Planctomycetes bacterium]|nr:beta-lactamase family protein [Planctomycetota bacterium]
MNPVLAVTSASLLLALAPRAQSLGCHDLGGIAPIATELFLAAPLQGSSSMRVTQQGVVLFEQPFGTATLNDVMPIASATKTLSAAVLMSLVDANLLSLDDHVGQYLPEWNTGLKALVTLRMCFTHTSGIQPNDPAVNNQALTLRQAAQQLAGQPLRFLPGNKFEYGGGGMHVAGAVCEVVANQAWDQLFAQRIALPLGMTATDYAGFGPTTNPMIAGGARSTLRDYARFVEMLRLRGTVNGVQVLSTASVDTMLTAQTVGLPIVGTPHPYSAPYGIGIWIDHRDAQGRTTFASGVGAFGFAGWIDRNHDASGVYAIHYLNQISYPYLERMWQEIDAAVLPPGATCLGAPTPACAPGVWLNGDRTVVSGASEFTLRVDRAPASSIGAMLLGDPLNGGLPVFDLSAFLGPQIDVIAGLVSDANGRATLAASLLGVPAASIFGLQSVWLSPAPCTAMGLQASHGLRLDVQ